MKRKIIIALGVLAILLIAILLVCDQSVAYRAKGRLYDSVDSIPHRKVGLVLGTSPKGPVSVYHKRINAAAELYNAGKVDWLIVSGGDYRNTQKNGCDEPITMRNDLIRQGVDSARIILDYDGTRTLNSIAKVRDIYRQDSITIISQKFHNERALFQAHDLGIDAIAYNAKESTSKMTRLRNRGREVLSRVNLYLDKARGVHPDIKESLVHDFTIPDPDVLTITRIQTPDGDLICLKPDMDKLQMDLVCGTIPSIENDSIILAFAGAFTGTMFDQDHGNIAGDHVAGGIRYRGYRCARNTGAFTWTKADGPRFHYQNYSTELDRAAAGGGMAFAQEMMIHNGKKVPTTRPSGNSHVFRALCLDSDGQLAIFESQGKIAFGKFIDALMSQGVKEALYTDMGPGWNYCFYRLSRTDQAPQYLHSMPAPNASNFAIIKIR